MEIDASKLNCKASKNADELGLYQRARTYIEAYSQHTDLRVHRDGPAAAIGGDWEEHGRDQLKFLVANGLRSDSYLLDFGCGTGRFARHAAPFLDPFHYTGVDISKEALSYAIKLSIDEGWSNNAPVFLLGDGSADQLIGRQFDVIWMHSVFTHLPPEIIIQVMEDIAKIQFSKWLFTYKQKDELMRTGLKQFCYPVSWFKEQAKKVGLRLKTPDVAWTRSQYCLEIVRG